VFASGTATNPSISFIADSNTGLYSPGADQIAITTNGAGRLFVNSSGSVGIGTSSPSAPFHVAGSARIGANDTSTVELSIGEGATGDRIALLDFVGDTTYSDYGLRLIRAAGANGTSQFVHRGTGDFAFITNEGSPLIFYTNNSERLRIDSSGRVGIGTTSPSFDLTLDKNVDSLATAYVRSSSTGSSAGGRLIVASAVGNLSMAAFSAAHSIWPNTAVIGSESGFTGGLVINAAGTNPLQFYTNSSERARIDSSGNVGIGTSSPISRLHINDGELTISTGGNTSDAGGIINFGIAALPSYSPIATVQGLLVNATGTELQGGLGFFTRPAGAAGQSLHRRMTLSEAGNLGIGVSSPGYRLDITSADTTAGVGYAVRLRANATAGAAALQFTDNGATTQYGYIACDSSSNLKFATGVTQRACIDSSGRLLVGTSSSTGNHTLVLQGNSSAGTGEAVAAFRRNKALVLDDKMGVINLGDNSDYLGAKIEGIADGTWNTVAGTTPGRIVFSTTAGGSTTPTERMRIDNSGSIFFAQSTTVTPGDGNTTTGSCFNAGVALNISRNSGPTLALNRNTDDGTIARFLREGLLVGRIDVTTIGTSYVTSSDYRLKENVVPLNNAIDRLQQIPVYRFNFIADPDTTVDGFLAHEAQAVVHECVTGAKDEVDDEGNPIYQGIDQSKLVPLLTAALQEVIAKIKVLEAKVTALERV
jgi:hypothetical protein